MTLKNSPTNNFPENDIMPVDESIQAREKAFEKVHKMKRNPKKGRGTFNSQSRYMSYKDAKEDMERR